MGRLTGDYSRALQRELGFDRWLAARACEDFAEYLGEMVEAHPDLDPAETERRALAGFGEVHDIARSYASAALPKRLRQALGAAGWLALATFLFMRWRSIQLGFDSFGNPTLLGAIDGLPVPPAPPLPPLPESATGGEPSLLGASRGGVVSGPWT